MIRPLIQGDKRKFAIESVITQPFARISERALGYFNIWLNGNRYGVARQDATMLAASYDGVLNRLNNRGHHKASFGFDRGDEIARAYLAALYDGPSQNQMFFGLSAESFREYIHQSGVIWAPDGDAAFDDGSHVLQFDEDARVHLVAFKNLGCGSSSALNLSEIWLDCESFYETLETWRQRFESEWSTSIGQL
jgi:hypothetical protein